MRLLLAPGKTATLASLRHLEHGLYSWVSTGLHLIDSCHQVLAKRRQDSPEYVVYALRLGPLVSNLRFRLGPEPLPRYKYSVTYCCAKWSPPLGIISPLRAPTKRITSRTKVSSSLKNTTYRSVGAKFLCAPTIRLAPARTVICGQSGTSYISENDKRWVNLLPRPADACIIRVLELHLSKQLAFLSFGSSWWRSRPQEKIKPQRRKGAKIRGKQKKKEKVKCALCFSSCPPTIAEQCCRNADASFCPWARFAYIFWDSETLYSSKRASASRVSCSGTPRNETVSALHRPPAPTHSPINAHPVHTQNIRFLNLARMFAEGQRRGVLLKRSADAARDPRPVERQFFFFFSGRAV